MKDTASAYLKLFWKGRWATNYINLYEKVFKEFINARSKGHVTNLPVCRLNQKLQAEIDPTVEIKDHVIVWFLQRIQIRVRSK